MNYIDLSKEAEKLSYRDKFRLAQLLIQLGRKEEEAQKPELRQPQTGSTKQQRVQYVADRLRKLRPAKKKALLNSIGAMFQFQGGISEADKERMFAALQDGHHIAVAKDGRITYPDAP